MSGDHFTTAVDAFRKSSSANGLRLLVLFGSRATGSARDESDWDFGYLASEEFDPDSLIASLVERLHAARVDLVNLAVASSQLRYHAARDGQVVFDRSGSEWTAFWLTAVDFWCDAGPVIAAAHASVLERLGK